MKMHQILQKIDIKIVGMVFDAESLYPSAMSDDNSVYPKLESRFAFQPYMNGLCKSFY